MCIRTVLPFLGFSNASLELILLLISLEVSNSSSGFFVSYGNMVPDSKANPALFSFLPMVVGHNLPVFVT